LNIFGFDFGIIEYVMQQGTNDRRYSKIKLDKRDPGNTDGMINIFFPGFFPRLAVIFQNQFVGFAELNDLIPVDKRLAKPQ
jgi:hypothetical protein